MTLERVTENNINDAIRIQEGLFPGESGRTNFEESLEETSGYHYYLIHEGEACVGIIGLYTYPEDPDSAWLGWFGIIPRYRRKGLGSKALGMFEKMAVSGGFRFARLYTDAKNNDGAIAFYQANGYTGEPYQNPQDPAYMEYQTLVFSKPLGEEKLVPWSSRNIHLTEQIAKQEKYNRPRDAGGLAEKS